MGSAAGVIGSSLQSSSGKSASMSDIVIRPVAASDRALWEPLWLGYLAFYEKTVPQAATEFTWKRLLDPANPIEGLLAVAADGTARGLGSYLLSSSTGAIGGYVHLMALCGWAE